MPVDLPLHFIEEELIAAMKYLKKRRVPGHNIIPAEVYCMLSPSSVQLYCFKRKTCLHQLGFLACDGKGALLVLINKMKAIRPLSSRKWRKTSGSFHQTANLRRDLECPRPFRQSVRIESSKFYGRYDMRSITASVESVNRILHADLSS